jgi:large subunit ribosomal protein L3
MAGHMGQVRATIPNLSIVQVDAAEGLLFVSGSVPGSEGSYVMVRDAVKRVLPKTAPKPAGVIKGAAKAEAAPAAEAVQSAPAPAAEENKE